MNLSAKYNGKTHPFEVMLFRNDQQEQLIFLIIMPDKEYLIAEKTGPRGTWKTIFGGTFAIDFKVAIFDAIDNASFLKLIAAEQPIDKLADYYTGKF